MYQLPQRRRKYHKPELLDYGCRKNCHFERQRGKEAERKEEKEKWKQERLNKRRQKAKKRTQEKKRSATVKKTGRQNKGPSTDNVSTAVATVTEETIDDTTISDNGTGGNCGYECNECLGNYRQDLVEKNGTEWI